MGGTGWLYAGWREHGERGGGLRVEGGGLGYFKRMGFNKGGSVDLWLLSRVLYGQDRLAVCAWGGHVEEGA